MGAQSNMLVRCCTAQGELCLRLLRNTEKGHHLLVLYRQDCGCLGRAVLARCHVQLVLLQLNVVGQLRGCGAQEQLLHRHTPLSGDWLGCAFDALQTAPGQLSANQAAASTDTAIGWRLDKRLEQDVEICAVQPLGPPRRARAGLHRAAHNLSKPRTKGPHLDRCLLFKARAVLAPAAGPASSEGPQGQVCQLKAGGHAPEGEHSHGHKPRAQSAQKAPHGCWEADR